jgi:hypothetical protein
MKKLTLILSIFLLSTIVIPYRTVTGTSTTIAPGDDNFVIIHTGGSATYTLGTVADGFSCTIVNHGTGNIILTQSITTANGQTVTVVNRSNGEIIPGQIGNKIRISRINGVWRSI